MTAEYMKTIIMNDRATGEKIVFILKRSDDHVEFTVSLETDGDMEALLLKSDVEKLISALNWSLEDVTGP